MSQWRGHPIRITKEIIIYANKNQKGFGLGLLAATLSLAVAVVLVVRQGEAAVHPVSATLTKMDYAVLIQQAAELQQHVELIASETDTDWQAVGVVNGKLAVAGINTATITAHPTYISDYSVPVAPRGLAWKFGMSTPTDGSNGWRASEYSFSYKLNPVSIWAYVEGLTSQDCKALRIPLVTVYSSAAGTVVPSSPGSGLFWLNDLAGVHTGSAAAALSDLQPACVYEFNTNKLIFAVSLVPSKSTQYIRQ